MNALRDAAKAVLDKWEMDGVMVDWDDEDVVLIDALRRAVADAEGMVLVRESALYPSLPCVDKEISVAQVVEVINGNSYRLEWYVGKPYLPKGAIIYAKVKR